MNDTTSSSASGRRLWAGLSLLDRQIVAHEGRLGGCVDDLELELSDDGNNLIVTAILSGAGALSYRLGRRRFGIWLRRMHTHSSGRADDSDPTRIPFNVVSDLGASISVGLDADEVGIASGERWARDHIIAHIPGGEHEPE
jgi:hypothetical protein